MALVTGGAAGIGRATAVAFAKVGASVVVADLDEAGGRQTVQMVEEAGGKGVFVRTDVTKDADVANMVDTARREFGRLDFAFNNAGIEGALAATADYPEDAWQKVLDVNLTGVWRCMKHEIPLILEGGGGAIVNNASILGLVGFGNAPAYTAAKHGVVGLTKAAAQEYAQKGIRINAVCPGFIETPMVMERGVRAGTDPEMHRQLVELHPQGRLGKPEEIAAAVVWLCSGQASFVTGYPLAVDGGYTSR